MKYQNVYCLPVNKTMAVIYRLNLTSPYLSLFRFKVNKRKKKVKKEKKAMRGPVVHWAKRGRKEIRKNERKKQRESEMDGCPVTLLGRLNEEEIKKGRKRE